MAAKQKLPEKPADELARLRARVAELESAQSRLVQSEQQFRELFSHSPIGMALCDADCSPTRINPALQKILGVADAASLKGHCLFDSPNVPEEMKKALRKGRPVRYEYEVDFRKARDLNLYQTTKSGVIRLDVQITPIFRKPADRPVGFIAQAQDVTTRHASAEALHESEGIFHTIFDKAATGIVQADVEGHIWEANPAFREMFGYSAAEIRGMNMLKLIHPDDREGDEQRLRELVAGRRAPLRVERRNVRKDGQIIFVSVTRSVCRDAAGKPQFLIAMVEDITLRKKAEETLRNANAELEQRVRDRTAELAKANDGLQAEIAERRRAEQALRESEETIRALLNATTDVMVLTDAQGRVLALNEATARNWHKSPNQIIGHTCYEFFAPDVARERKNRFEEAVRTGAPVSIEDQHQSAWWDANIYPVRDPAGKVFRLAIFARDITARKRMEEALRESEARLRSMFSNAPIGMMIVSPAGRLLQVNRALCDFLGSAESDLLDKTVLEITHPDDRDATVKSLRLSFGGTPIARFSKRYLRKDGQAVWGELSVSLVRDAAGAPLYTIAQVLDVTERKRAEEALHESEARFRTAFENGAIGMVLTVPDGTMTQVNPAFCRMVGYTEAELINRPFNLPVHPDDMYMNVAAWNALIRGETSLFRIEKRFVRKDGRILWVDISSVVVRDADNRALLQINHIQDITERKQAEEALRESEARFRAAFENGAIGMMIGTQDGIMLQANPVFCTMLGYTEAELVHRSFNEITHPQDLSMNLTAWNAMIRGEASSFRIEKRLVRKDSRVVWADINSVAVRDVNGAVLYQITHVQDITERKRAEEALRASETRYRALFDDAPVAVAEYDCSKLLEYLDQLKRSGVADFRAHMAAHPAEADLCFATLIPLDANQAALNLLKARDRSHLLQNIASTICDETRSYIREAAALLASGGATHQGETVLRTLTGEKREVWISSSFIPPRGGSAAKALIATADLTELRAAERELTRQREVFQLQRTETLAATGRLAAGVAHEINNPLQGIVAQLKLLDGDLPQDFRGHRRIELINGAVDKIAKIVSHLLLLHRPPRNDEKSCSAAHVIGAVAELIFPQAASRRVHLEVAVQPPEAVIPLSSSGLTQILLNLLLNAMDAIPDGGVIQIEASQTAEAALLLVSDTGSDILPEHRGKLFSPFFTTKGPIGTGLGLAVTHSLVTEAGGTIDVADRKGGGTVFSIRFPVSRT